MSRRFETYLYLFFVLLFAYFLARDVLQDIGLTVSGEINGVPVHARLPRAAFDAVILTLDLRRLCRLLRRSSETYE